VRVTISTTYADIKRVFVASDLYAKIKSNSPGPWPRACSEVLVSKFSSATQIFSLFWGDTSATGTAPTTSVAFPPRLRLIFTDPSCLFSRLPPSHCHLRPCRLSKKTLPFFASTCSTGATVHQNPNQNWPRISLARP